MENYENHAPMYIKTYSRWLIFYPIFTLFILVLFAWLYGGSAKAKMALQEPLTWIVIASSIQMASITTSVLIKRKGIALQKTEESAMRVISLAVGIVFALIGLLLMIISSQA